jgi:predicted RNA methylase
MRSPRPGFESAIATLYRGMAEYADATRAAYDGTIGDDYVLGESWKDLGNALIGLLNGETGRLDCGTLDGQIRDLIESGGTAKAVATVRENTAPPKPEPRRKAADEPIKIGMAALSDRQRELLNLVRVEDNFAVYTGTERIPDWDLLKRVMLALGGTWARATKKRPGGFAFADDCDALELVRLALETGEVFDPRAADFFPTPYALADVLVERTGITDSSRVLEPSAGTGAICRAIKRAAPSAAIHCFEAIEHHREQLRQLPLLSVAPEPDFMAVAPEGHGPYTHVAMNPPFGQRNDIRHVMHAFSFLAPGGTLGAIMSAGVKFREDRVAREFRTFLAANDGEVWDNPPGSFKESGTGVNTVMVRVRKSLATFRRASSGKRVDGRFKSG